MAEAKKSNQPIVIVGGFMSAARDYRSWQTRLEAPPYNRKVFVANINRLDWVSTADQNFRPQLLAVGAMVQTAIHITGAEKVTLVCHSAGGRISRLWLGDQSYGGVECNGRRFVKKIIFLGSPYLTREPWAQRSAGFANKHYPGAYYAEIEYISVVGRSVFAKPGGSIEERFAYRNYRQQFPRHPQQWGDGVVPVEGAFVPGATNGVLDGIYHGSFLGKPGYENPKALAQWGKYLLENS